MANQQSVLSRPKITAPSARVLAIVVFLVTLGIYLVTLPRSLLPGDSGELIVASRTLSIGHPPGYPLYLMLGKLFASVFAFGSVAWRYNLYSAVLASATAGLMVLVLVKVGVGQFLSVAVAVGLATLETYWLNATTAEVYALNALFTALLIYIALEGDRRGEQALLLLGLVGGLALSHHLSLIYALVSAVVIWRLRASVWPSPKTVTLSFGLLCLGLSVWLYIPIRASLKPPIIWSDPSTFSGFMAHITGRIFKWNLRTYGFEQRLIDFLHFLRLLAKSSGGLLLALACVGVVMNARNRRLIGGLGLLVALYGVHYVLYHIPDIDTHTFPALLGIAVLAGLGLQKIQTIQTIGGDHRIGRVLAISLGVLVMAVSMIQIHPRRDQWLALDYAHAIEKDAVAACGESCVIVCNTDVSFPLLYDCYVNASPLRAVFVGLEKGPQTLEGWIDKAVTEVGSSRVAILGPPLPQIGKWPSPAFGLVRILGRDLRLSESPPEPAVRGVGEELRDFASRRLTGDYYLRLAGWAQERGDTNTAREIITRVLEVDHGDVIACLDAAWLYRGMGRTADERQMVTRAIDIDPDSFEAHGMMGGLALRAGELDLAIAEYKKSLKGSPPAAEFSNLGAAYFAKRDYVNAYKCFAKAIAADSTIVNAHVGMGLVLEAQGNLDGALKYYDRALRLDPSNQLAIRTKASLLLRMRR